MHPSDRGSPYASHAFQNKLKAYGRVCSMSQKGNCWDTQSKMILNVNVPTESGFNSFKNEPVHGIRFVIARIAEHPLNRVADLLPWAVAKQIISLSAASSQFLHQVQDGVRRTLTRQPLRAYRSHPKRPCAEATIRLQAHGQLQGVDTAVQ
jgi:hypothetical protein